MAEGTIATQEKEFKNAFVALADFIINERRNSFNLACNPKSSLRVVVIEYDQTIGGEFKDEADAFTSRHVKLDDIPKDYIEEISGSRPAYNHAVIELKYNNSLIGGYFADLYTKIIDYMPANELYTSLTGKDRDIDENVALLNSDRENLPKGIFRFEDPYLIEDISKHACDRIEEFIDTQRNYKVSLQHI